MTPEDIQELFIRGAETERRLPVMGERPDTLKAQALPYINGSDDVRGWGGARYQDERSRFWESRSALLTNDDVSAWERCNDLMMHVSRPLDRVCLWAWAASKAKTLRIETGEQDGDGKRITVRASFRRWCRKHNLAQSWALERKNHAISQIGLSFVRNALTDIPNGQNGTLSNQPGNSDKDVNIAQPRHWNHEDVHTAKEAIRAENFDWAKWRNEQRRQREARKRQAA